MCGRFGLMVTWEELAAMYGLIGGAPEDMRIMPPRHNIAPTQPVLAIRSGSGGAPEATFFHWGLVPSWAKDIGIAAHTINARAETVAEKPAFRTAFRRRRCLIPASGFYEWQAQKDQGGAKRPKQPYWIAMQDGTPFSFAGLWETWESPDGGELHSCTIVTTSANESLKPVHHRMPVIVAPADQATWLAHAPGGREHDTAAAAALMRPLPDGALVATPVGRLVNNVRNDGPDLIRPAEPGADLPPRPDAKPEKPARGKSADSRQGSLF